jgi:hypothetical protein
MFDESRPLKSGSYPKLKPIALRILHSCKIHGGMWHANESLSDYDKEVSGSNKAEELV